MNNEQTILRGFATVNYWAEDVDAAVTWYSELLGKEPYFKRSGPDGTPLYAEFRVGDYQHELGLISRRFAPPESSSGPGGVILYWHVDDVEAVFGELLAKGAKTYEPVTVRGEGFVTASVTDPFGNVLGVMYNKHYLDILKMKSEGRAG